MGISELMMHEQPLVTGAMSAYPYSAKLARKYQFASRFGDLVKLYAHDEEEGLIWLPRALCPIGAVDKRSDGESAHFPKCPEPRDYQEELFEVCENLISEKASGVIVAPTAWGKTLLGYKLAYERQRKTLVITTKEDIFTQWIEGAPKFLGIAPEKVGQIRQNRCDVNGFDFVVALIQSLSIDKRYPDWIFEKFGLVILDENHRVPATQFSSVIGKLPTRVRIGLSATPDRKDGKELVFYSNIGPVRAKAPEQLMIPKVIRVKSSWECPRGFRKDKITGKKKIVRMAHEAGKTMHMDKLLAVDKKRNNLIATFAVAALSKGRDLVIFSSTHLHLSEIEVSLKQAGVPKSDIGWYVGATTKKDKEVRELSKVKPVKLTTWAMMGEGTSIDWIDTAILASPRADVRQPVGRIRREYPDKRYPLVIDIIDNDSPVFAGYARSRLKWYNTLQTVVEDM